VKWMISSRSIAHADIPLMGLTIGRKHSPDIEERVTNHVEPAAEEAQVETRPGVRPYVASNSPAHVSTLWRSIVKSPIYSSPNLTRPLYISNSFIFLQPRSPTNHLYFQRCASNLQIIPGTKAKKRM
jgi:hypothetical protein